MNVWQSKQFEELIVKSQNSLKLLKSKILATGVYPVIDQSQKNIAGYTNEERYLYKGELPVVIFGDHTLVIKYADFPFVRGADGTKILTPNRDYIFPKFLYYLLLSKKIISHGYARHYRYLRNIIFQVPPLSVQQQIVERLDAIRKLQELNNREIEKAEELFNSLLRQQLAQGDNLTPLTDVAEINPAVSIDKSKPIPFISMADVDGDMGRIANISYKENIEASSGSRFENGDVLFARITPCTENGKIVLVGGLNTSGMGSTEFYVLRAKRNKSIPYFIYLLTRLDWFKQQAVASMTGTSGRQRVPKSFFENVLVPAISLSDQRGMQAEFSQLQEYQAVLSNQKEKLSELFESTLNKAMKGELVN